MKLYIILLGFLMEVWANPSLGQQKDKKARPDAGKSGDMRQESVFNTTVPAHSYDIILARPTDCSISFSILSYKDAEGVIEYREQGKTETRKAPFQLKSNKLNELVLSNLKPSAKYLYNVFYKPAGGADYQESKTFHFQTQRKAGQTFAFTITADSHLDQNADTATYKATLQNALADSADFHIDLGDTYMTDKYRDNYKDAQNQYIAQRYYFGQLNHSSPLFFVLGNHDGETAQKLNGTENSMTVWSNLTRKNYFLNPVPNQFYSGNGATEPFVGQVQDYYAFEWGNALFVVLDPFWFTPRSGNNDPWERTLGEKQYDWLKTTLEKNHSKFKFIFIHNLVGGIDMKGLARGGAEAAPFYEWGGKNADGTNGFTAHRPGWEMPIHNLLVKNKVTAVFHGHDHLYAQQELDGVIYQCLPQPGEKEFGKVRHAEEYGYINGVIKNGPGYLRVTVSDQSATIEYVSTNVNIIQENKNVLHKYQLK